MKDKMKRSAYRIVFDQSLKLDSETSWVDGYTLRRINESKDILQIAPHEYGAKLIDAELRPKPNRNSRHYIRRGLSFDGKKNPRKRLPSDFSAPQSAAASRKQTPAKLNTNSLGKFRVLTLRC